MRSLSLSVSLSPSLPPVAWLSKTPEGVMGCTWCTPVPANRHYHHRRARGKAEYRACDRWRVFQHLSPDATGHQQTRRWGEKGTALSNGFHCSGAASLKAEEKRSPTKELQRHRYYAAKESQRNRSDGLPPVCSHTCYRHRRAAAAQRSFRPSPLLLFQRGRCPWAHGCPVGRPVDFAV